MKMKMRKFEEKKCGEKFEIWIKIRKGREKVKIKKWEMNKMIKTDSFNFFNIC